MQASALGGTLLVQSWQGPGGDRPLTTNEVAERPPNRVLRLLLASSDRITGVELPELLCTACSFRDCRQWQPANLTLAAQRYGYSLVSRETAPREKRWGGGACIRPSEEPGLDVDGDLFVLDGECSVCFADPWRYRRLRGRYMSLCLATGGSNISPPFRPASVSVPPALPHIPTCDWRSLFSFPPTKVSLSATRSAKAIFFETLRQ